MRTEDNDTMMAGLLKRKKQAEDRARLFNILADWAVALRQQIDSGMDRKQAIRALAAADPVLHEKYIAAHTAIMGCARGRHNFDEDARRFAKQCAEIL